MPEPDPRTVVDAANAWVWVPPDAERIDTEDYTLVRFPDHLALPSQVLRTHSTRPVPELLAEVAGHVRRWRRDQITWWVTLDTSPVGLEQELLAAGADLELTLSVLAADLSGGMPDLGQPADLDVRPVRDAATARDGEWVDVEVFGGSMPPDDFFEARAESLSRTEQAGTDLKLVGYLDGTPVGSAGLALADGVARLWGGAVLESARHRGVYRALLAARLRWAIERGATLALVKGRVETSGPILRRVGFAPYGEVRAYVLGV